jgi:hypothetical protein
MNRENLQARKIRQVIADDFRGDKTRDDAIIESMAAAGKSQGFFLGSR